MEKYTHEIFTQSNYYYYYHFGMQCITNYAISCRLHFRKFENFYFINSFNHMFYRTSSNTYFLTYIMLSQI